jgi:hypothetical protein
MDIAANLMAYLGNRKPTSRYTSFDYCFNYFRSFCESGQLSKLGAGPNMQYSCLHLGFYLASWGMIRGSTDLLNRSIKHYAPLIEVVASSPSNVWEIDAHCYTDENCAVLEETAQRIRTALHERASHTLVTKIMLGVFGCVPAFDIRFRSGFRVSKFGGDALRRVSAFYRDNVEIVERHRVSTLDFDTGQDSKHKYTRAKVIDMIFFVEGGKVKAAPATSL